MQYPEVYLVILLREWNNSIFFPIWCKNTVIIFFFFSYHTYKTYKTYRSIGEGEMMAPQPPKIRSKSIILKFTTCQPYGLSYICTIVIAWSLYKLSPFTSVYFSQETHLINGPKLIYRRYCDMGQERFEYTIYFIINKSRVHKYEWREAKYKILIN